MGKKALTPFTVLNIFPYFVNQSCQFPGNGINHCLALVFFGTGYVAEICCDFNLMVNSKVANSHSTKLLDGHSNARVPKTHTNTQRARKAARNGDARRRSIELDSNRTLQSAHEATAHCTCGGCSARQISTLRQRQQVSEARRKKSSSDQCQNSSWWPAAACAGSSSGCACA